MKLAGFNKLRVKNLNWILISFRDTLTSKKHNDSFRYVRSEYLQSSIAFIAVILSFLAVFWMLAEYFFILKPEIFNKVAIQRGVLTLVLILITHLSLKPYKSLIKTQILMGIFILMPQFFYISVLVVVPIDNYVDLIGYQLIPFLMVALLTVFPLTIIENIVLSFLSFWILIFVDYFQGNLFKLEGITHLWLLIGLWAIAILANYTQLIFLLKLYRQASYDFLTGLVNRTVLLEAFEKFTDKNATDNYRPISCIMFDLDRFKRINDIYGHNIGDITLKNFANIMLKHFRVNTDIVSRYGGEEFIVLMPKTSLSRAVEIAEKIRLDCENYHKENPKNVAFTVSAGVIELKKDEKVQESINRVDMLLYEAKQTGRNRIISCKDNLNNLFRKNSIDDF